MTLIATVSLLVLCASIGLLISAQTKDSELLDETEKRLLLVLEKSGIAGLTVATQTINQSLLPPSEVMQFAIWRKVADTRLLLAETMDGVAEAMRRADTQTAVLDASTFLVRWPDVATVSEDWEVNYSDVELGIALHTPTAQMKTARMGIASICAIGAVFLLSMVWINRNHQSRYARGLDSINQTLDLFAQGHTDMRVSNDRIAPEIDRLTKLINDALSRIDQLTNGLRYMSAHLAHELNTPLQKIRVVTSRIVDQPDLASRQSSVNEIDRMLETARARQRNLMQLFRLEAGEVTQLDDRVNLGALVAAVYEDFENVLEIEMRQVSSSISPDVEIQGNRPLCELLVSNILTNAGKYAAADSHIRITLVRDHDHFRLTVSNDGGVFPESVRAGSFRRFVRADDGAGPPGAGLGLNLVFAICEAHGFDVTLPNKPNAAIIEMTGKVSSTPGAVT